MKELCNFNTTIKLNFDNIVEKIVESPENKPGALVLLNFIFYKVRDEFTLEIFMDKIKKISTPYALNICSMLDNSFNPQVVKLEDTNKDSFFAEYLIKMGMETNNSFLSYLCHNLLISIMSASNIIDKELALSFNSLIVMKIFNKIKDSFDKVKVFSFGFLEDKEIEEISVYLNHLLKNIKFCLFFVQSKFKFLFLAKSSNFNSLFVEVYSHMMDFVYSFVLVAKKNDFCNSQENMSQNYFSNMKNKIYDISIVLLNCFYVLLDTNIGFKNEVNESLYNFSSNNLKNQIGYTSSSVEYSDKYIKEDYNNNYDIINNSYIKEELPDYNSIILVIKEIKKVLEPSEAINMFVQSKLEKNSNNNNNKYSKSLIFYLKSIHYCLKIITKLSRTYYGQTILSYGEYIEDSKIDKALPLLNLNNLFENVLCYNLDKQLKIVQELKNNNNNNTSNSNNNNLINNSNTTIFYIKCIISAICEYTKLMNLFLLDLHYFEFIALKQLIENSPEKKVLDSIFTLIYSFKKYGISSKTFNKFINEKFIIITKSRLDAFILLFFSNIYNINIDSSQEDILQKISSFIEAKNDLLKINDLNFIINTFKSYNYCSGFNDVLYSGVNVISNVRLIKLDLIRDNSIKYDMLLKFRDFLCSQSLNNRRYIFDSLNTSQVINQGSMLSLNANSLSNVDLYGKSGINSNTYNYHGLLNYINKINNYAIIPIHDFEKLLDWKKQRIYGSKENAINNRINVFNTDVFSTICCDDFVKNIVDINDNKKSTKSLENRNVYEKVVINNTPFELFTKSEYNIRNYEFINTDYFQQYGNALINNDYIAYEYSNLNKLVVKTVFDNNYYNTFDDSSYIEFSNNLIFSYKQYLIESKNDKIDTDVRRKKITSKYNAFVYIPKYSKINKTTFSFNMSYSNSTSKYNILIIIE